MRKRSSVWLRKVEANSALVIQRAPLSNVTNRKSVQHPLAKDPYAQGVSVRVFVSLLLLLLPISHNVSATKDGALRTGLETLMAQEYRKYHECLDSEVAECDFGEVYSYLNLLDLWHPISSTKLTYPRSAKDADYAGFVRLSLTIKPDGSVSNVEPVQCESGKGDPLLRFQWEVDGRHCAAFTKAAERALLQYTFPILPSPLDVTTRQIEWQAVFQAKSLLAYLSVSVNAQITDLSASQAKKIRGLSTSQKWAELEKYALNNWENSPIFKFYAAEAAWAVGNKKLAVERYRSFLTDKGHSYWHLGTKAAVLAISHLYDQADDNGVVSINAQPLLPRYLKEGDAVAKPLVAEALLKFASSSAMLEDPQLGRALLVVRGLESYASRTDKIPAPLKNMITAELANYEAQIINFGQSGSGK